MMIHHSALHQARACAAKSNVKDFNHFDSSISLQWEPYINPDVSGKLNNEQALLPSFAKRQLLLGHADKPAFVSVSKQFSVPSFEAFSNIEFQSFNFIFKSFNTGHCFAVSYLLCSVIGPVVFVSTGLYKVYPNCSGSCRHSSLLLHSLA